jgi:hypothetical protein
MPKSKIRAGLGFALIAALLVVLAGVAGSGPLGFLRRSDSSPSASIASPARTGNGRAGTTTTIVALERRDYRVGDCVTWDQRPAAEQRVTHVVSCAAPHLIEIAGSIDASAQFKRYPTDAQWHQFFAQDCLPSVRSLLGRPLDPIGRFTTSGIKPLAHAWEIGDRKAWCGVEAVIDRPHPDPNALDAFRGKVEGASQVRLARVGACLAPTSPFSVPCKGPHQYEITGYVDLAGVVAQPPALDDDRGWEHLVGARCANVGRPYLGHALAADARFGWLEIPRASWAAGRRTVECTVARYDASNKAILTSGSLKA